MVTSLRRCQRRSVSGTPAFTPRFLRIAPLFAEDATGSHICNGDRHRRSRPLYRIDRLHDLFWGAFGTVTVYLFSGLCEKR